jgi:pyridoxamine 5'-phosphate oxidase family protein
MNSVFTAEELEYLRTQRLLGRLATVGRDGMPHVAPVGWSLNEEMATIDIGGRNLEQTKKFRDVANAGKATIVIDDVLPPWRPRGIEIRGRAEALSNPSPLIRIHPERVIGWGLDKERTTHHARTVGITTP